jgi:sRNA-binding protein
MRRREHFPPVFVLEGWQSHKPLKINEDIAAAGIMSAEDIGPTLRVYVRRLMYQRARAAGGARYDLNGELCEVTAEQAAAAYRAAHASQRPPEPLGLAAKRVLQIPDHRPDGSDPTVATEQAETERLRHRRLSFPLHS